MPTANLASALQAAGQHVQRLTPATPVAVLEVLQKEIDKTLRVMERVGSERRRAPPPASVMAAGDPLEEKVAVPREEKVAVPEVAVPRQGAVAEAVVEALAAPPEVDRGGASPTRPQPGPADAQPVASSPKRSAPDDDDSRQPGKLPRIPKYDITKYHCCSCCCSSRFSSPANRGGGAARGGRRRRGPITSLRPCKEPFKCD
jgi:hypothetical protein